MSQRKIQFKSRDAQRNGHHLQFQGTLFHIELIATPSPYGKSFYLILPLVKSFVTALLWTEIDY
jgi:hypothetical protein